MKIKAVSMNYIWRNFLEKSPCSAAPKIVNGYNRYGSTEHGSKALYECFNGFELDQHNGELKCSHGEWVGKIPTCLKSNNFKTNLVKTHKPKFNYKIQKANCNYPGPLVNGKLFYIGTLSEYTYQPYMKSMGQNKQIRYECDIGI
jgi:hypothetical protein